MEWKKIIYNFLKAIYFLSPYKARYSTHNGMPTIIFKASNYYGVKAEECRFIIVGKFLRTRPQIEKIGSKFAEKISVKGSVRIGFTQKLEYENVPKYCRHSITQCRKLKKSQKMMEMSRERMYQKRRATKNYKMKVAGENNKRKKRLWEMRTNKRI